MTLDVLVGGTVVVTAAALVTYRLLRRKESQVAPGRGRPEAAAPAKVNVRTVMMVVVSVLVLGSSLFIILSGQYDNENQKWAFGAVGTIVGFWLRPEK
jgi:ABC-type Fe3+ transport system permease subunit